jgi:hypothetical protein
VAILSCGPITSTGGYCLRECWDCFLNFSQGTNIGVIVLIRSPKRFFYIGYSIHWTKYFCVLSSLGTSVFMLMEQKGKKDIIYLWKQSTLITTDTWSCRIAHRYCRKGRVCLETGEQKQQANVSKESHLAEISLGHSS